MASEEQLNEIAEFLSAAQGLDPTERDIEMRRFFDKKVKPLWGSISPEDRTVLESTSAFGPGIVPFEARSTKEAVKPFMPETSAAMVKDIMSNPRASLKEKATVLAAHALGYPYAAGKAVTPDIARGRFTGLGSFFPQGRGVVGGMGADVGRRIGSEFGSGGSRWGEMLGQMGGYGASYMKNLPSLGGGNALWNAIRQKLTGQFSAPTLSPLAKRILESRKPPIPQEITGSASSAGTTAASTIPRFRDTPQGPVQLF